MTDTLDFAKPGGYIPETKTGNPYVLSVLYVDDEPLLLDICKLYLEQSSDISVSVSSSVEYALALLETTSFDVIISDYQMPGTDGIGFLKILRKKHCTTPVILFTGSGGKEVMVEALNNGAMFYLRKGGHPRSQFTELTNKIREAFLRSQVKNKANDDLRIVRHAF